MKSVTITHCMIPFAGFSGYAKVQDSNIPDDSLTCSNHSVPLRLDSVPLRVTINCTEVHGGYGRSTEIKKEKKVTVLK